MAEPEKDQIGDGQDNFGQAAGKAIQAAKQISHDAAAEAAVKGAEATANAAAAVVQAGAASGKAVRSVSDRMKGTVGRNSFRRVGNAPQLVQGSGLHLPVPPDYRHPYLLHPEYRSGQCVWPERGSSRRRSHAGIVLL